MKGRQRLPARNIRRIFVKSARIAVTLISIASFASPVLSILWIKKNDKLQGRTCVTSVM